MNRRDFLAVAGGVCATPLITNPSTVFAAATTPFYVRGLVMVSFEDPSVLRLGFPKAPGHKATLAIQPQTGSSRVLNLKGKGTIETKAPPLGKPNIAVPELVRMKEFYGDAVRSRVEQCPTLIEIPYAAIQSITTSEVSTTRYTFLRADTGREVESFKPRQIAESIKIVLTTPGTLKLESEKTAIPLESAREIHAEYIPESTTASSTDVFADHFHHYLMYLDRPAAANFDVVPKKLGGTSAPTTAARNFIWPFVYCYMVAVP